MIKKELIDNLAEVNFWYKEQEIGIERDELGEVSKFADMKDIALIILGVRRAGKTYLTKQILHKKIKNGIKKEQTLYVNFEDKKLEPYLIDGILDDVYESYRYYINKNEMAYVVFDEVHNVSGWEKWVRTMLERKENIKIIVTGSGSKILTPELASILTGRKITYNLFPLSFKGFLEFKGGHKEHAPKKERDSLLREYIEFGAIPLVVLNEGIEQKKYFLQEVYDDIITKDIMLRYSLREENILRKCAYLTMNNFSKYVSIRKIRNSLYSIMKLNVSPSTLSYYLDYFEKSFLFIFVPIFSYNIKDQMQYPRKVYCVDCGMINSIIPKFSENIGKLYENIVAIELKRRREEIYYWQDSEKREVDFIIKDGLKVRELIQVCLDIGDKKTRERELGNLVRASEELKCKKLIVIAEDKEGEEIIEGKKIKFIPLWKWLLEAEEQK